MSPATLERQPTPLTGASAGPVRHLPPKLVEDAAARLAWLALLTAILIVFIQTFQRFAQPSLTAAMTNDVTRLATLVAVLMALGIFALHRYRVVLPSTLVTLGMCLEVVVAFCISMIET